MLTDVLPKSQHPQIEVLQAENNCWQRGSGRMYIAETTLTALSSPLRIDEIAGMARSAVEIVFSASTVGSGSSQRQKIFCELHR